MTSNSVQKLVDELETQAVFAKLAQEQAELNKKLSDTKAAGTEALKRLLPIVQGNSGQCRYVASFLLSLYNSYEFSFALSDLRRLDANIIEDCLTVLRMNCYPGKEIYEYVENGQQIFEDLAKMWNTKDHT